jgi:hypothetical protein
MSTPLPPQYAPFQSQPQPPAPKKRFNWKLALAIFAAVLIGGVIGSVSNPAPPPVVQVQEKEVEVEKEVTPASCLEALDLNEEAFSYLSDSLSSTADQNYTAARRSTDKVVALVPKVNAAKAACRAK